MLDLTFNTSWSICPPSHDLVEDVTLPIYNDHGYTSVWEIGYAFVADYGDEFGTRMSSSQRPYMLKRQITVSYARRLSTQSFWMHSMRIRRSPIFI